MHWLLIGVGLISAVVLGVVIVGWLLPVQHRASIATVIQAPPQAVWDIITNFERIPEWRSGISAVARLARAAGGEVWQETDRRGESIAYEVTESVPVRRLVRRIATPDLPFGGSWTIDLDKATEGTNVRITENGEVYNPLFRFISRFIMGTRQQ